MKACLLSNQMFFFENYSTILIDLSGLTFSHRPDEVASVWRLGKLVCNRLVDLLCFSKQEII